MQDSQFFDSVVWALAFAGEEGFRPARPTHLITP